MRGCSHCGEAPPTAMPKKSRERFAQLFVPLALYLARWGASTPNVGMMVRRQVRVVGLSRGRAAGVREARDFEDLAEMNEPVDGAGP